MESTLIFQPARSLQKSIFCQQSGVLLGTLDIHIIEGHLAYLEAHTDAVYLHPFYRIPESIVLSKLRDALKHSQELGWVLNHAEQQRLQLLTSALLTQMGCLKQEGATLPSFPVSAASAGRLIGLASWFYNVSSRRLAFPIYSVSKRNDNLHWENFKDWLDAAYLVREDWAKKSRTLEIEAKIKAQEESMKEIKSESYRRVDTRKVWNWIELQLIEKVPPGRIATFKELFLNGDLEPHEWDKSGDDVEDLQFAITQHCDIGNEITHFINKRLSGINAIIHDFYSSFTLITKTKEEFKDAPPTEQENKFFGEFDIQAAQLETMPDAPKREHFATTGLFLKAEAQWRILSRRFSKKAEVSGGLEKSVESQLIDLVKLGAES